MTLPGFRAFIAQPAHTNVLCFISAYLVGGLEGHYYPELYGPDQVNVAHTVRVARENADIVRGVKAVGMWKGQSVSLDLPREDALSEPHDGVAVVVQEGGYGRVIGAAFLAGQ